MTLSKSQKDEALTQFRKIIDDLEIKDSKPNRRADRMRKLLKR